MVPLFIKGAEIFFRWKNPWKKIHPPPGLFVPNEPVSEKFLHQNRAKHPSEHLKLASHSRHRRGYLALPPLDPRDGRSLRQVAVDGWVGRWLGSHLRGTGFFKKRILTLGFWQKFKGWGQYFYEGFFSCSINMCIYINIPMLSMVKYRRATNCLMKQHDPVLWCSMITKQTGAGCYRETLQMNLSKRLSSSGSLPNLDFGSLHLTFLAPKWTLVQNQGSILSAQQEGSQKSTEMTRNNTVFLG